MRNQIIHEITPSKEGMNILLKSDGHEFYDTLAEIIDNARDQNAKTIDFHILKENKKLVIVNNGKSVKSITEMMVIGSQHFRNKKSVGKYGVGLKHFLSYSQNYFILSKKKNGTIEVYKSVNNGNWHIIQSTISKEDKEIKDVYNKYLKKHKEGVLFYCSYKEEDSNEIENFSNYQEATNKYFYSRDIKVKLNNKIVIPVNLFGEIYKGIEQFNEKIEGVKITYLRQKNKRNDVQGSYLLFNGRLINKKGYGFFNHPETNGFIILIEVDSWDNPILKEDIIISNQKNSIKMKKRKGSLYYKLEYFSKKAKEGASKRGEILKQKNKKQINHIKILGDKIKKPKHTLVDNSTYISKKENKVVAMEFNSLKEIDDRAKSSYGDSFSKYLGNTSLFEARFNKQENKWILCFRANKNVDIELKALVYDQYQLNLMAKKYKFKYEIHFSFSENTNHQIKQIVKNLKELGIFIYEN